MLASINLSVEEAKMTHRPTTRSRGKIIMTILFSSFILTGCAIGTTELKVGHNELDPVAQQRQGKLLVHQFKDARADTTYIGNKRNGFGMVLGHVGMSKGQNLETLLSDYFAEALQEAGYSVTLCNADSEQNKPQEEYDAVIDGDVITFWMDLYGAVWHRVAVVVTATDPQNAQVLWSGQIDGSEKRVLWVGATGEYERIIREALTKALNNAAATFSSDEFYNSINRQ